MNRIELALTLAASVALVACGGRTDTPRRATEDAGPPTSAADAAPAPLYFPPCGALDLEHSDRCTGLDHIVLSNPRVTSMVQGEIQLGETARVTVFVENDDTVQHDDVCVGLVEDTSGVDLAISGPGTDPAPAGDLPPGSGKDISPAFLYAVDVNPGKRVTVTLYTTYQATSCVGQALSVSVVVRPVP